MERPNEIILRGGVMNLGCSAELTGKYLAVIVEYGDNVIRYPERVQTIHLTIKNSKDLVLREWTVDGSFENSDGLYHTGTILANEEDASQLLVSADTVDGLVQAQAPVFQKRNQITANHF